MNDVTDNDYTLLLITNRSETVWKQHAASSIEEACAWHVEQWNNRKFSAPVVLVHDKTGQRYCFNDSKQFAKVAA